MAHAVGVVVSKKDIADLLRRTDAAGGNIKKYTRQALREAAEPIRANAAARFARYDFESAATFGVSVRKTGTITVEQRRRRTTRKHPEFGVLQMRRALIPALRDNQEEVLASVNHAVDLMIREWAR